MNPNRIEEIYDLNLDIPGAKGATVRRYQPRTYRSANWRAEDRRRRRAIGVALMIIAASVLALYAI